MTARQEKVNSLLQQLISSYLIEEKFDGITGLLTITSVDVSPDLEHAKVFFSALGQDPEEVLEILNDHLYEVQSMVFSKLAMKKAPRVAFISDVSEEHAGRINKVLKDLRSNEHQD